LALVLDAKGNVFGGFTPIAWESRTEPPFAKADASRKSFLFTLKNPHGCPARAFALKGKGKHEAICCDASRGPVFGGGFCDLAIASECSANDASLSYYFGSHYENDTGEEGKTFFTASWSFTVNEIEVFEVTESTSSPMMASHG
jgi:hypothetical protein